jgi:HlyD family secretion protein
VFSVDAYRADQFNGKISEVRLEPQTVQNVVTYSVIVDVENPQLKLKPGMTANLTMIVDEHDDVLTAPNAALRFTPANKTQDENQRTSESRAGRRLYQSLRLRLCPQATDPITKAAPNADAAGGEPEGKLVIAAEGPGGGGKAEIEVVEEEAARVTGDANTAGTGFKRRKCWRQLRSKCRGFWQQPSGGNAGGNFSGGGAAEVAVAGAADRADHNGAILWIEESPGVLKPISVRTGLTDGTRTEVSGANLMEGTEVVMSDISQTTTAPAK